MRIFLSYGHDGYSSLALRIKSDLEALGHEVWFDLERLRPGGDWERYIEEGLEFASREIESGRFLLLMTPHSVRRPDGYCLNELARAHARSLPIIPVTVSTIEPPLSICRLQWLDMRQCFPAEQHEDQYRKQFAQLVTALTEGQVPFEGVQQRLVNYLQPITYGDDLARHLPCFTGREWAITEVDEWLASSRRILWITGEAGIGKSAFAAWLCNKRSEVAAYHFCRFGNSDRVDARRALLSLAYQLSTQLPVYRDRLNASSLDKTVVETNLLTVFDRLFVNLLSDAVLLTERPQVLLIDALDEATRDGRNELASLLGGELDRLPPWLRVIVTSRPYEQEINFAFQALDPSKLDAGRPENLSDIRKYLRSELRPFAGGSAPSEEIVETIVEKSEGLFLYATWVRQELQGGRLSLGQVEQFPRGLGGVYADFFQRYFPDPRDYAAECRPALEAICAAREPLDRRDLALLLGRSEYEMRSLSARLGSLFPAVDGRVRPFHQSVRDWLIDPARSGRYWIDVSAQEQRLADLAWGEFKDGVHTMGPYCIKYGPSHLAACQRKTELKELLLDPGWMEAKLQATGVVPLLADYDLALDILSPRLRSVEAGKPTLIPIGVPPWTKVQQAASKVDHSRPDDRETSTLSLVRGAIRLSAHVLARDSQQLRSQLTGRLLSENSRQVGRLLAQVRRAQGSAWLRPLSADLAPPRGPLLLTLSGQASSVTAVAVTRDGKQAVSGSNDNTTMRGMGTLKVWDLGTGRELRTLTGHTGGVNAVAVTPDGKQAVSGSNDNTLKVWDLGTGRELRTLTGHTGGVNAAAVTPDGKQAVSGSNDNTLKVWDLESGRALRTLKGHSHSVNGVAVTPDGKRAVSASADSTLKVWDLGTGRALRTLEGHSSGVKVVLSHPVSGVAVTPDGKRVISASADKTLKVWDLETGRALRTLEGHSASVHGVAVTPDGKRAVSASWDNTLKVWDLGTGRALRTLEGHSYSVNGVAVTPDGKRAVSASRDSTLKVWDLESRRALRTLEGHSQFIVSVGVTPDGKRAVSASADSTLKVWDLESRRALRTLEGHSLFVDSVAVTPDGKRAVSGSGDETLKVWDLESGRALRTLEGHYAPVSGVAVTPDGKRAVSASRDNTLMVWDLETGRALRTLQGHAASGTGVAVTPDGKRAVFASRDNTLIVWDLETGRALRMLESHSDSVHGVAVTPDGKRAISASSDKTLKVWDLETGRALRTLEGHSDSVSGVAVTPDGKRAVSASRDNTLKVWDLETAEAQATFTCDGAALCCAFDRDKRIISGDAVGRVHFLSLEEPKPKH